MCGIAGFSWTDGDLATRMTHRVAHRGPDQSGVYVDDGVSLGSRRLSIIDLSENGRMPMSNEDGSVWVTYNGEIFNFRELRDKLRARGHTFRSATDTEVIVHAYEEYGPDCVKQFNGMFAFAIWDRPRQRIVLARDRLGIKPLYYYLDDHKLTFGSEMKVILEDSQVSREINYQSLYYFMGYEYVPAPNTVFRHIYKLPPGHYLCYSDGKAQVTQYWDLRFQTQPHPRSYYEEGLRELLAKSVRQCLVSDVPLGAFLSGGLDSSAIVAFMNQCGVNPIHTFSLGYEDPSFSELNYAQLIARRFNTHHRVLNIDPITSDVIEDVVWALDEPMSELSNIPLYLLCRQVREHVTVALSGDGGDEVLVGYDRFLASKAHAYYRLLPGPVRRGLVRPLVAALHDRPRKKERVNLLKRFIEGGLLPEKGSHVRWQYFLTPEHSRGLFKEDILSEIDLDAFAPVAETAASCTSKNRLDREVYLDLKLVMPEIALMKVDRMSMAHGLEVRVPFLDHEFVEFCATIPADLKLRWFTTKDIFRSAMKGLLPDEILTRGKQGFSMPIKNWLRHEMRDYMQEVLLSSPLIREVFNQEYIQRLVREHLDYRANHSHLLWALVNLGIWHRLFVEDKVPATAARRS